MQKNSDFVIIVLEVVMKLSLDTLPQFIFSSPRQFLENEHHIERYTSESVLILLRKGHLCFEENGTPVRLNPGEYYIQRPNMYQTGIQPSLSPNYYYIHFYGEYQDRGLPLHGTFIEERIRKYTDQLDALSYGASSVEIHKNFYAILSELSKTDNDTPAIHIKNFILQNYNKAISLDDISAELNFSKNHIIRIFSSQYGKTPYRFLTEYRLEKARQLLLTTDQTCEQIGYSVGFEEYSIFFKAFRNYYGISPSSYSDSVRKRFDLLKLNERSREPGDC